MIESRVQCPACGNRIDNCYYTYWMCGFCRRKFPCVQGIPKLYMEESLGKADKDLRDRFYNTFPGKIYNFLMPFLLIPVRPIRISRMLWLVYFLLIIIFGFLVYNCWEWIALRGLHKTTLIDLLLSFLLIMYVLFLLKHPFITKLLLLAVPTKISLSLHRFKPLKSHESVHAEFQEEYVRSNDRLRMLDVATGSCNSLFRHGWMKLNADYTGVDLSETMLIQGMKFMSAKGIPVDFILCDATRLPFESETFDIVTSYGAINAYTDPKRALEEMTRVTKKGGKILFLDEQEYESARLFERAYFKHVLTAHNTINGCPVNMLPKQLEDIQVHQVYEFIYICTARKKST